MDLRNVLKYSPRELKRELDKVVVGQDKAKKELCTVAYSHLARMNQIINNPNDTAPPRFVPLVVGPSGSGKTLMVETLANLMELPYLYLDATSFVSVGGSDDMGSLPAKICNFYNDNAISYDKPNGDKFLISDYSVVFIDEADKLFLNHEDGHNASYYENLRNEFLIPLDGKSITYRHYTVDTSKMLIILGGAFTKLNRDLVKKSQGIGFKSDVKSKSKVKSRKLTKKILLDETKFNPEVLGRIDLIVHTEKLSKDDIRNVIFGCYNSIFSQFDVLFDISRLDRFKLSNKQVNKIVKQIQSEDNEFGMRLLKSLIFKEVKKEIFRKAYFELQILPEDTLLLEDKSNETAQ